MCVCVFGVVVVLAAWVTSLAGDWAGNGHCVGVLSMATTGPFTKAVCFLQGGILSSPAWGGGWRAGAGWDPGCWRSEN